MAGQYNSHSRIVIFPFGVKKSGLYKDEVRSPQGFIGNNNNGEVSIQECPRLFRPGITIVISVQAFIINFLTQDAQSLSSIEHTDH